MRHLIILLGTLCISTWAAAQPTYTTTKTTTEKARKDYDAGRAAMRNNDAAEAIRAYKRALETDPNFVEARFYLGGAHYAAQNWADAEAAFEQAMREAPDYEPGKALLPLAEAEYEQGKYTECADHAAAYAELPGLAERSRKQARRLSENARFAAIAVPNPVPFVPKNLGAGINSIGSEYLPTLTADGSTLIFTRLEGGYDENFYESHRSDSTDWDTAEQLEGINTTQNEGAQAISADGSWLVFTACNRRDDGSQGSCDLYLSQIKNEAWTKPTPFAAPINTASWDAQPTISADGRTIYFSSERPGGSGGRDLWQVSRTATGKWGAPLNLGTQINTEGNEQTPFIHPDGKTLYFTSDGHPGMGQNDLYMVRMQPNGAWSTPLNLGYPINTRAHEGTLSVSLDGTTAYFAADRPEGLGRLDIYSFELPQAVRPEPVTYARIKVTDATTGRPLVAKVELFGLPDNAELQNLSTKKNGMALFCLPTGVRYGLNVTKNRYLFHSEHFDLVESGAKTEPYTLHIELWPVAADSTTATTTTTPTMPAAGHPVVLKNVFFTTGSSELRSESNAELDVLARFMTDNPTVRIQINGHTDDVGDDASNQRLSEARAESIKTHLIAQKVSAERIRAVGFGERNPVAPNDSDANRAKNRRTEFEVW
jgi:outer membrane protein OmpA-like peptidoglycan-associated protein